MSESPAPRQPRSHRREPERAHRSVLSALTTLSRSRLLVGVGGVLVLVAGVIGVRAVVGGDEPAAAGPSATTEPGQVAGSGAARWDAADGSTYEIAVETLGDRVQVASPTGCLPAPDPGATNLRFRISITNLSAEPAPVPQLDLRIDGAPDVALVVERTAAGVRSCKEVGRVGPKGREKIPAGDLLVLVATFGPVTLPVEKDLSVVYGYYPAGSSGEPTEGRARFALS